MARAAHLAEVSLLAQKRFATALLAEPTRSESDDDGSCDLEQTPHIIWLLSEGTPEPQQERSGSPSPPAKSVTLPPSPLTERETADDSCRREGDDVAQVDMDEQLRHAEFEEGRVGLDRGLAVITSRCDAVIDKVARVLQQPVNVRAAKLVHREQMRIRSADAFYETLMARVRELGYICPDVSDPVFQRLLNDRSLSRGIGPAQAVKFMKGKLRNELKTQRRRRRCAYPPGGSVELPPRFSARCGRVCVKYGLTTAGAFRPTTVTELPWQAAFAECEKVIAATRMARPRASEQAWRGGAMAGAIKAVRRAAFGVLMRWQQK